MATLFDHKQFNPKYEINKQILLGGGGGFDFTALIQDT